jgi:hypothetical protein
VPLLLEQERFVELEVRFKTKQADGYEQLPHFCISFSDSGQVFNYIDLPVIPSGVNTNTNDFAIERYSNKGIAVQFCGINKPMVLIQRGSYLSICSATELGFFVDSTNGIWAHNSLIGTPAKGEKIIRNPSLYHKDQLIHEDLIKYVKGLGSHIPYIPIGFDLTQPNKDELDQLRR